MGAQTPNPAQERKEKRKTISQEIIEWGRSILAALLAVLIIRNVGFLMVRVDGTSMLETLQNNDILFVTVFDRFLPDGFQRGDVVICNYPEAKGYRVKRIIGLPGETVEMRSGAVYIDGEPLEEEYIEHQALSDFGPFTVPEGEYFLLGDNRPVSKDSRQVGAIEKSQIRGKVRLVVFPFGDAGAVR